jgi:hypothetical protein
MTKSEIIKRYTDSMTDTFDMKNVIIGIIEVAYDAGFDEGMKRASEIQRTVLNILVPSAETK